MEPLDQKTYQYLLHLVNTHDKQYLYEFIKHHTGKWNLKYQRVPVYTPSRPGGIAQLLVDAQNVIGLLSEEQRIKARLAGSFT